MAAPAPEVCSAVIEFVRENAGRNIDVRIVSAALVGSVSADVSRFSASRHFGCLSHVSRSDTQSACRQLLAAGLLALDGVFLKLGSSAQSRSTDGHPGTTAAAGKRPRALLKENELPLRDSMPVVPPPRAGDVANHGLTAASFRREAGGSSGAGAAPASSPASGTTEPASSSSSAAWEPEQAHVFDLVSAGRSVFFTGAAGVTLWCRSMSKVATGCRCLITASASGAGTGKSHLLKAIIASLRDKYDSQGRPDAIAITAPTGIAACNIGGTTLHSFAGLGIRIASKQQAAAEIERRPAAVKRWKACTVLVVDEVGKVELDADPCRTVT